MNVTELIGSMFATRPGQRCEHRRCRRRRLRIAQAAGELHCNESPAFGTGLADISLTAFDANYELQYGPSLDSQLAQSGVALTTLLRTWVRGRRMLLTCNLRRCARSATGRALTCLSPRAIF